MLRLRRALAAFVAVGLCVSTAATQSMTVPHEVQLPGTQPLEAPFLAAPQDCLSCHAGFDSAVEPGHNWQGSMMSHAARDPLFWAAMAVAERSVAGGGDLCLRCHVPTAWVDGRSTPTDGSAMLITDAGGVTCDTCHRLTNPDTSEHFGLQTPPFLAHDESAIPEGYYGSGQYVIWPDNWTKLGPYDDAQTPHGFLQSTYHRDSHLCGTCHDVSNPYTGDMAPNNGAQVPLEPGTFSGILGAPLDEKAAFNNPPYAYGIVERTFSEHFASNLRTFPVAQYSTMPGELQDGSFAVAYAAAMASSPDGNYVDGTPRFFTCQTCHLPPVTGKASWIEEAPERTDLPLHELTGGNYWVPEAIAHLDSLGKLTAGGGMTAGETAAMLEGADRARANLEVSASLNVLGDKLLVTNLTGHKLISGYPEGRRMWLSIEWKDAIDQTLRHDGAYGTLDVLHEAVPLQVESILDLDDPYLHQYTAHHGMSQAWAEKLVADGIDPAIPLTYDRLTGAPEITIGELAVEPAGTTHEAQHFLLNDVVLSDTRIPPWGLAYDETRKRNALPVPDTQYGNPGPGGTYDHWSEVNLDPPVGAVSATIELLYQPTSWEYIQFLALTNDGSIATLAEVGDDLLVTWLLTGMAAPHVMATTSWTAGATVDPWLDLGDGMAGLTGTPRLRGHGSLTAGHSMSLSLENAAPGANAFLIGGLSAIHAPFKGGVFVPARDLVVDFAVGPAGTLKLDAVWPEGITPGSPLWLQYWIADPAGPQGFAASNAVKATSP